VRPFDVEFCKVILEYSAKIAMGGLSPEHGSSNDRPLQAEESDPACSDTSSLCGETFVDSRPSPELLLEAVLARSSTRSTLDALKLVGPMFFELDARRGSSEISLAHFEQGSFQDRRKVWQAGSHVHIPRVAGSMFVITDLEGHKPLVESIFRKHDLLSRMMRRDPNDHVHLCVLGDTIDRDGWQASEILEFLYELKLEHGLWDNIHILSGNHELNERIQKGSRDGGFYLEVLATRESYRDLGDRRDPLGRGLVKWSNEQFDRELTYPPLRAALWRVFNEAFKASPLTVTTENGLCLSHAGITNKGLFASINAGGVSQSHSRAEMFTSLANAWRDPEAVKDLTWSDFSTRQPGISANFRGMNSSGELVAGPGIAFGIESTRAFLDRIDKKLLIRGHQPYAPHGAVKIGRVTWAVGDAVVTTNTGQGREYLEIGLKDDVSGAGDVVVHRVELP
jgi:hypothetical protein